MKLLLVGFVLLLALALEACAHGQGSNWDKPNPPDAGPELKFG